jgi:hypothetical protein
MEKILFWTWVYLYLGAPFLFLILAHWKKTRLEMPSLRKNYFSYYVIASCSLMVLARLFFVYDYWEAQNIILILVPILTILFFLFRLPQFVFLYFIFSTGTLLIYTIYSVYPEVNLRSYLPHILAELLQLSLFGLYLLRFHKAELVKSFVFIKP